jgi:hypothetical protein
MREREDIIIIIIIIIIILLVFQLHCALLFS